MDPPVNAIAARAWTDTSQWGTAPVQPNETQLDNIKTQIDLVLLALEALLGLGSDAMLQAATELGLQEMVSDRVALWRLRQSNPMRRGTGGRKKLDIEEARSLVLISCHLAQKNHDVVRRAVCLLEESTEENRQPHQVALLGDYLDRFTNLYQDRMDDDQRSISALTDMGLKLLIDLLFFSSAQGVRRFWMALLDRTYSTPSPSANL
ncbi:MAG: DUF3038 domain-containing protein [Thermosynechococcaceae cyanobacterium]